MDNEYINSDISIYFRCRILASKNNESLRSRESTSEYLGVSVSSLANYERGITVPPMDIVLTMVDLYNAPQLGNLYCKECPLGKQQPIATEISSLELTTIRLVSQLDRDEIVSVKKQLLKIASDGKVTKEEEECLKKIMAKFEEIAISISELRMLGQKILGKAAS